MFSQINRIYYIFLNISRFPREIFLCFSRLTRAPFSSGEAERQEALNNAVAPWRVSSREILLSQRVWVEMARGGGGGWGGGGPKNEGVAQKVASAPREYSSSQKEPESQRVESSAEKQHERGSRVETRGVEGEGWGWAGDFAGAEL